MEAFILHVAGKPMSKKYKRVEIEWIDSKFGGDWEYLEEIIPKPAKVTSIGYLIDENEEGLTIAHSVTEKQCCGRITIPKVCIAKKHELLD